MWAAPDGESAQFLDVGWPVGSSWCHNFGPNHIMGNTFVRLMCAIYCESSAQGIKAIKTKNIATRKKKLQTSLQNHVATIFLC